MSDTRSALEYLVDCSDMSLESFQVSRLSQAANLRKQVQGLVDQWIGAEVDAKLSRWMLRGRNSLLVPPLPRMARSSKNVFLERVAVSFLLGNVELPAVVTLQRPLMTRPAESGGVAASRHQKTAPASRLSQKCGRRFFLHGKEGMREIVARTNVTRYSETDPLSHYWVASPK